MMKRKSQLLKDSGSAVRAIKEKAGGAKPKKVSKEQKRRIEEAAKAAIEKNDFYRRTSNDLNGTNVKLF